MGARAAAILAAALAATLGPAVLGAGCMSPDAGGGSLDDSLDREVREKIEGLATARGEQYEQNVAALGGLLRVRAVPLLVEALDANANPRVRAGCALALADAQDPRALEPLSEAADRDEDAGVRYTAAYALLRFRDPRGLPVLFRALRSEDPQTRFVAIYRLKEVTGEDLGFVATDPPADREVAVARWESWYREVGPGGAGARLLPPGGVE
jgi:HEAT repeat protein